MVFSKEESFAEEQSATVDILTLDRYDAALADGYLTSI
jgi:hypothetical protein